MSNFTHLVTCIADELRVKGCDADAVTICTTLLSNAEEKFQTHFTGKPGKKVRAKKERDPNAPKKTNWQAVWTSNANGCRAYPEFQTQLQSLETANPNMGRFEINKQLKAWAEEHSHYAGWQEWAKARLVAEGKPVPQDKTTEVTTTATEESTAPVTAKTAVAPVQTKAAPKARGKTASVPKTAVAVSN